MLSLDTTYTATSISLSPDANTIDLTLLTDGVAVGGKDQVTALNDFNIAQLQLQYEGNSMDNPIDTMHPLDSIDILHHDNPHAQQHIDTDNDLDLDYEGRRMSSSALSSASAQSAHSVRTSTTAATSHSGFSAHHGQSLKRAQSPGVIDEYDSYDAFDDSPRVKRPRPSLSLEPGAMRMDSASPAPTNTTASAGAGDSGNGASGNGRVQLPPLYSAIENTSNSAPPTSHGTQAPFAQSSGQLQLPYHQSLSHGHSQSQNQTNSSFPTSNFAFNVSGAVGLDLRRGSLPSLYSNSLAARSAQRQGQFAQNQFQSTRSAFGFTGGLSPGPSPLSSLSAPDTSGEGSGLAGYQFPAPSSLDSGNGSNSSGSGEGSTPTPTPGTSPFGSGVTPTSSLSSGPNSSFPQTPLDFAQQQQSSSPYQTAYGQQTNQKEYDRFAKEYLTNGAEWSSNARQASSPSSASALNASSSAPASSNYGYANSGGNLGGLPRISGHAKNAEHQQQDWYPSNGQLVLPSPTIGTGSSSSTQQSQQHQHPQTASLSPSPRIHSSSSGSSSAAAAAAATAAALNVSPAAAVQAAQVAAQVAARPARRRGKLPKPTTDFLKDWLHRHSDHPYPSEEEKKQLCHATGLSMSQVSNWMINARRRILAPAQRTPQGPTTTVPSFPLGSAHSGMNRTPLGLSPAHSHGHHGLSSSHLSQNNYGMGMPSGISGMGLGLIGGMGNGMNGMGGMGYQQQPQHQLHAAQGFGMPSNGGIYQQQQYRQQQAMGHAGFYDLSMRRASMPALALNGHSQAHMSPLSGGGNGSLHLYPPTSVSARSSLPGALPQVGYAQQQQHQQTTYSPQQGQLGSPAPQRGYVFPPTGSTASNSGAGNTGEDGR